MPLEPPPVIWRPPRRPQRVRFGDEVTPSSLATLLAVLFGGLLVLGLLGYLFVLLVLATAWTAAI